MSLKWKFICLNIPFYGEKQICMKKHVLNLIMKITINCNDLKN